ncbi:THUMP domain-containing protein 1-like [Brachyhypopomus gauderio]|uniref:THUMP domain-containing protein 1-like n=1 Tax=Brachyhypopomus gauderio TaxID=698409 RepID=UPI004042BCCC
MSGAQEEKKRSKKRYGGPRCKRLKGARELEVGMRGVLVTCNMNERKCTWEAYSLLNEYADELFGPEKFADPEESHSEEEEEEEGKDEEHDTEVALKKEVKQFKKFAQQRRFVALDSGANNVVFIRAHDIDPEKLVHRILQDLRETKKKKSRVIMRMLPVSGTCRAFPDDMEKFLSSFLEPWFKTPHHASYQISYKARNNNHSNRDDVIKALAGLVGKMNPKNKVDLTNPELTIIVEIIKTVCCVSVVRDYMLFRKYNLQEVTKGPPNQEQGQQEVTKGPPNQEQGQQEVTKGPPNQEQGQQEVTKGPPNQEQGQQEVTKGPPNQEQGQQEVTKGPPNQQQGQQEVTKGPPNQEQGQQEVAKSEANVTAEQNLTERGRSEGGSEETTDVAQGDEIKRVKQE